MSMVQKTDLDLTGSTEIVKYKGSVKKFFNTYIVKPSQNFGVSNYSEKKKNLFRTCVCFNVNLYLNRHNIKLT